MNTAHSFKLALLLSLGVVAGSTALLSPSEPRPLGSGEPDRSLTVAAPKDAVDLYGDPLPEGAIARMGSIQLRHAGQSDFVVLPDGKTIVTAGGQVVRFWDLASGRLVRQVKLQGPFAPGRSATPSPDGKILAGIDQNKLVFWDTDSGKQIKTLPGLNDMWAFMYFTPDSRTLFIGTWKQEVIVWDWQKGTQRRIALLPRNIGLGSDFHGRVSPDGKLLSVGSAGKGELLGVYELATGRVLHRLICHPTASTFSPDGKRLIVASSTNDKQAREAVIRVFDVATGKEAAQFPLGHQNASFFSLAASPDGKTLACGFSDHSCLLDLTTGRVVHPLPDRPIQIAFSPDGKRLIADMGYRLRIWDPVTGKAIHDHPGDFGWELAMAVSPDGRLLAAADWMDQSVALWDTASGRLLRQLPLKGEKSEGENKYVRNLAFSPDGKTLRVSQYKGCIQAWETASGKDQRTVQLNDPSQENPHLTYFFQLHVSLDGKRASTLERILAQGEPTRLAYWDMETGKLLRQHFLPPQTRACAWSADGTTVTLPLNKGLTQMSVESGKIRYQVPGTRSGGPLAASPDDRLLAAVRLGEAKDDAAVGIWEAATGKEVANLATGQVSHLALTPDNRYLVATDRGFLGMWDLATGKQQGHWPLPEANTDVGSDPVVTRLALSPDGRRAFTALNDGTALVWDLQPALRRRKLLAGKSTEKELAGWWNDLATDDARRAYAAIWRLIETPEAAVRLFRQHVKPATDADLKAIRRLIADLDSDQFATREKAFEQLAKLGPLAEPAFRQALEQKPPVETRRRIQLLLEKIDQQLPTGELLRLLRALQVLENTGAQGRRLLRELAGGAEEAWLTHAAKTFLSRLATDK